MSRKSARASVSDPERGKLGLERPLALVAPGTPAPPKPLRFIGGVVLGFLLFSRKRSWKRWSFEVWRSDVWPSLFPCGVLRSCLRSHSGSVTWAIWSAGGSPSRR
jgi:hypothetical protein